ncbi:MAG: FecR family protein, partial [Prevotella sp.]
SGEIAPKQDIEGTLKLLQLTLPFSYKKLVSDSNNSYFEVTSK